MSTDPTGPARPDSLSALFGRELSGATLLFHQAVAEQLGLNTTDLKCLDLVRQEPVVTAGLLAERTGLTTAAITAVLDRLVQARCVQRERDPNDRRRVLIRLQPDRLPDLDRLFSRLDQAMHRLCQQYTAEQLTVIAGFAEQVTHLLLVETDRLRRSAQS